MSSRYIPALDGLRALAVIAVVIYHMNATALQSGLLGVTIFFVLFGLPHHGTAHSGMVHHQEDQPAPILAPTRAQALPRHRIRPFLGTIVLTGVFAPDMLTKLRNDIVAALLFFTNWWYIFQDASYFEAMGAPSPVTHFWSLAIEEQFYLIWPPLLLLLLSKRVKKRHIQLGLLVTAIASAAAMAILYSPQADPSRVYYGTDTRAFSLLIGAFLAFEFPPARVNGHGRQGFTARDRKIALGVGSAALAGILVMMVAVNGYSPFLYYGGIALLSLLTGALIITLADGRSPLARFFALRPLVWIGKLSYSIYLWHYPLLLLMNPRNFTGETPWFAYVGQALVILAVSAISYYVVETPLRKGAIGKAIKGIREKQLTVGEYALHHAVQLGAGCILAVAAVVCLIAVPPTATQQNTQLESAVVTPEAPPEDAPPPPQERTVEEMLTSTEGETPADKARNTDFLLIGDSVSVALSDSGRIRVLRRRVPARHARCRHRPPALHRQRRVPAARRRRMERAGGYLRSGNQRACHRRRRTRDGGVRALRQVRLPGERALARPAARRQQRAFCSKQPTNTRMCASSTGTRQARHDEYFDGDGTHLTAGDGCQAYIELIAGALEGLYAA